MYANTQVISHLLYFFKLEPIKLTVLITVLLIRGLTLFFSREAATKKCIHNVRNILSGQTQNVHLHTIELNRLEKTLLLLNNNL